MTHTRTTWTKPNMPGMVHQSQRGIILEVFTNAKEDLVFRRGKEVFTVSRKEVLRNLFHEGAMPRSFEFEARRTSASAYCYWIDSDSFRVGFSTAMMPLHRLFSSKEGFERLLAKLLAHECRHIIQLKSGARYGRYAFTLPRLGSKLSAIGATMSLLSLASLLVARSIGRPPFINGPILLLPPLVMGLGIALYSLSAIERDANAYSNENWEKWRSCIYRLPPK